MLHRRLREDTQAAHAELERLLIKQIREIRSLNEYITLLKLLYGFHAPLEERIRSVLHEDSGLDFNLRRKASVIKNELTDLGNDSDIPLCTDLPEINSYHSALGAMYVLEGSAHGGPVIARLISKQIGDSVPPTFPFFLFYGENLESMWETFRSQLLKTFSPEEQAEIVSSAEATFIKFTNWVVQHAN